MQALRLSVALCTRNGARFLTRQLDSIASQIRLPDELVICDDGSTDGTIEILKSFAGKAEFPVRIEVNEKNLGSTKNFDKAIGKCSGDLIALSDQDDIWLPQKLQVFESIFLNESTVGLAFSDADVVDENEVRLGFRLWDREGFGSKRRKDLTAGKGTQVLLHHNIVTGATMAFRREFTALVSPIPQTWIHDAWIALLISVFAALQPILEPLIQYRKHPDQQVGPRPGTFGERVDTARRTRAAQYLNLSQNFTLALNRILSYSQNDPRTKAAVPHFEMKIRHVKTRAAVNMQANRTARLPQIARELLSHRYHLFSEGWTSAAKDLLLNESTT